MKEVEVIVSNKAAQREALARPNARRVRVGLEFSLFLSFFQEKERKINKNFTLLQYKLYAKYRFLSMC